MTTAVDETVIVARAGRWCLLWVIYSPSATSAVDALKTDFWTFRPFVSSPLERFAP